ncbi:ABC transporter substrate-binding protein [Nocardioides albidus]|uniref:ABC transporter substrate-binding protein n=1 Tax=Nocardioides albidus TaxID=1517589 RepID=A0A5C4VKY1_9ACTN|nr:ABC transporter substrate-binding protein [Nocardioides albidus]TNM36498.1 ABC transporter substrate-binding protein [Nocardioides albidus]
MKTTIGTGRVARPGRRTALATATLSLALVAAACGGPGGSGGGGGGGSVPGVTDDTIKIGTTQPLTGPAAPGYSRISKAMDAYFKHVNAEGGIHGRKVELLIEDDGYNPTTTAEKTRKLVQQDKVFAMAGALGTPTHTAVLDFLRQSKVPDLMVSSGSLSWNQAEKYPNTFGWQTDYFREGKILADYAKKNVDGKTYCSFGQGDDLGADGVKGVEQILGGDALKAKESYSPSNTNVAPQIGKLQAAKCDVVFGFMIPGFTALALGTSAQLDYHPQWVISSVGADPLSLKAYLKENAEALTQGVIAANYLPVVGTDDPWAKMFTDIHKEYNDGAELDYTTLHGYCMAYAIAQALAAAGEDPTRESLVKAIQEGKVSAGPSPTPYAYSEDDHSGMTGSYISTIDKLQVKPLTKPLVTDDADGAVEEYDGEAEEPPSNGVPE